MTAIVVTPDLYTGGIAAYKPPSITGEPLLAAWVGDRDLRTARTNMATGRQMDVPAGVPASIDDCFRQFSRDAYFKSDAWRKADAISMIAVMRKAAQSPAGSWGLAISSERAASDGGRRGVTLAANTLNGDRGTVSYTNAGANGVLESARTFSAMERIVSISTWREGSATYVRIWNLTDNTQAGSANTTNATALRGSDASEQAAPFLVGANYVSTATAMQLAYVGVHVGQWDDAARAAYAASLRRRLTALGSTA